MDPIVVSKIWVGMSANNINLLQLKIQGHMSKKELWIPVYQTHFEEKSLKFVTFQSPVCFFFFSSKYLNYITILNDLESTLCNKTIKWVLKLFILPEINQSLPFINLRIRQSNSFLRNTRNNGRIQLLYLWCLKLLYT